MAISIIRNVDSQGRLIIPADIRKEMGIHADTALEISTEGDSIRLRKCVSHRLQLKDLGNLLRKLTYSMHCALVLCTFDPVLAKQGVFFLNHAETTEELRAYIREGKERIFQPEDPVCYAAEAYRRPVGAIFPIRSPLASALLLLADPEQKLTSLELECARLLANVITNKYK